MALDVTPRMMMQFYTATEKKRADEALDGLADKLRPKWEEEE